MKVPQGVLVLEGTSRTIVAISRSLERRGIPVVCAQIGRRGLGLHSNSIRADVALPDGDGSFLSALDDLLLEYAVDTIFPCSDKALALLIDRYRELSRRVFLTCPERQIVEQVLQKRQTLELAARCGIRTPVTYAVSDGADITKVRDDLRFPLVAKPAQAGPSHRVKVAYFECFDRLQELWHSPDLRGPFIFQEFFAGEGVGISTVVGDDGPLILFQHRRLHEYPPAGGVGVLFESQRLEPKLAEAATTLLEALRWRGPAMVEFRRNALTGEYAFLEVNGRFWGSLPLSVQAGLDFPYWQWEIAHGMRPNVPDGYTAGVKVRWTAGEMQRFADLFMSRTTRRQIGYTIFSPFFELAKSFAPGTKSALFSVRDPQPELRDVGYTAFRVFASVVWRLSQKLLPERIARSLVQLRLLDAEYRKTYLALWLSRRSRRRRSSRGNRLNGLRRVTFVCRANRIRSPLAAALLASELRCNGAAEFCVQSAGTSASSEGEYDPRVREAARTMGLALSGAPQAVTPNLVAGSDLLVVMDHMVEAELLTQFPAAMAKTVLLGDLACHIRSTGPEILDPDRSPESQFDRFILDLARSVRQMARLIS